MRRLRILIVGAGIAGTAAASFLARRGHEVTVVERAGASRSSGSPVDIRGGALEVVRPLGAESALRARDTGTRTVAFVDRLGRVISRMRLRSAPDDIEIARADLAAVLTDAADDAVAFRFGETFTALTPDDHGVDVAFATGRQERFDLVVGADGQHSATRRALWDPRRGVHLPRGLDRALAGEADVPAALARYERELRPRMERAQRGASAGAAFLVPKTAAGIGVRNLIARIMRA